MDLSKEFHPVGKPSHKRIKAKRGDLTEISTKARKEVYERSQGLCERCGRGYAYAFEVAHLLSAGQGGSGKDPSNLALLCGPSVNTGTCHHFADKTREGREWRKQFKEQLQEYYKLRGE